MSVQAQHRRVGSRLGEQVRHPLLRNGYALVVNSGATALLGMGFWVLAARRFTVEEVGVGSALVAALGLLSTIAQLNLASMLARFLPTAGRHAARLLAWSAGVTASAAIVVGLVFLAGASWWAPSLPLSGSDPEFEAWFVAALVLWSLFVVQDGALSGLRHSEWVVAKNAVLGLLRLLALLVPAVALSVHGVFLAWTLPVIVVLVAVWFLMARRLVQPRLPGAGDDPQGVVPRQVVGFASYDYVVALVGTGLTGALPLLVIETSGAATAAYFALAWSVYYSMYLVGRGMATSLLVEAAREPARLAEYAMRATTHALAVLTPLVAAVVLLAPVLMGMFGPQYAAEGSTVLRLLALSALPSVVVVVYTTAERVHRRMRRLVVVTLAINTVAIVLIWVALRSHGLVGLGVAWLSTQSVAAVLLLVGVLGPLWLPLLHDRVPDPMVRAAGGCVAALRTRRQRHLLARRLPRVVSSLGLAPGWRLRRVLPTVGDVAVAEVCDRTDEAILKLSLTRRGGDALLAACRAVDDLRSDDRLAVWSALLPRTIAAGSLPSGEVAVLEELLPGRDGRLALGNANDDGVVHAVLEQVGALHEVTARPAVIDDTWLRTWVDEPLDVLEHWLAGAVPHGVAPELRDALRRCLAGREALLARIHGDLAPGNVLLDDAGRVVGIVDWEQTRPDGLPGLDVAHFLMTVRLLREDRELGDLVCDLLRRPEPSAGPLGDPALVLLTWLRHVVGIVSKTDHYSPTSLWASRNVHPVLRDLATAGPSAR